jgi:recombination protein RecA
MGDAHVGLQARLMSQGLRKLTAAISNSKCVVIFINQLREKVGVMYGNPETTTGGRALKFYSSVRLDIRRIETLKQGGEMIGNHVRVKVVKNKVAPPFREAEFDIIFGKGISKDGEIVDAAVNLGIISKGGAWFTYVNTETGRRESWQGREKVKEALANDEALKAEIEERVLAALYPNATNKEAE